MSKDITLKLPSGINAPTQDDIKAAKEYVLERSRAEIALAFAVDDILKEYAEQMIRVCYKYNMSCYHSSKKIQCHRTAKTSTMGQL